MAGWRLDLYEIQESEDLFRSPTSAKTYIGRPAHDRVANIFTDVRKLVVELDKMNLKDATKEFKRLRRES